MSLQGQKLGQSVFRRCLTKPLFHSQQQLMSVGFRIAKPSSTPCHYACGQDVAKGVLGLPPRTDPMTVPCAVGLPWMPPVVISGASRLPSHSIFRPPSLALLQVPGTLHRMRFLGRAAEDVREADEKGLSKVPGNLGQHPTQTLSPLPLRSKNSQSAQASLAEWLSRTRRPNKRQKRRLPGERTWQH